MRVFDYNTQRNQVNDAGKKEIWNKTIKQIRFKHLSKVWLKQFNF